MPRTPMRSKNRNEDQHAMTLPSTQIPEQWWRSNGAK